MKTQLASLVGMVAFAAASAEAEPHVNRDIDPNLAKGYNITDPSRCLGIDARPDIRVKTSELRSGDGNVRFVLYGSKPEEFLEKGKTLIRVEVPARKDGVQVCISAPRPGTYALAVLHDENNNEQFNMMSDGGGFSNNPTLFLGPPSFDESKFKVGDAGSEVDVEVKYMVPKRNKSRHFRRR